MADSLPRFITPAGFARIRAEFNELFAVERPKIVETVSWAASLGDRSENADYLYGKRRLREIDRRLAHLARIMKAAKVVDPAEQPTRDQVRFGATVELRTRMRIAAQSRSSVTKRPMRRRASSAGARLLPGP
jgi:transcription elongation factor GreB